MRSRYFLILIPLLLFSCTKDRLRGDKDILEGKWRWVKSTVRGSACNPPETPPDVTPASKGREESIEFIKKGYFKTYIDGIEQQKLRMKFEHFEGNGNTYSFIIKLGDYEGDKLQGHIANDTIVVTDFFIPFDGAQSSSCRIFYSYFVRE